MIREENVKVLDAVWEERNLGVKTVEIVLELNDSIDELSSKLNNLNAKYIVVKIPSQMSDFTSFVQSYGFRYIEDMVHVEHDLSDIARTSIMQRLYDSVSYELMDDDEFKRLYDEIMSGMFESNRISNDNLFEGVNANIRYLNWVKDLKDDNALFYVMKYKGESSGFIVLKDEGEGTYYSVLGGAYIKFRKTGLGSVQKEQEIVKKIGGKRVITAVSTNNCNQLKALVYNGYKPFLIEHIFVKHI